MKKIVVSQNMQLYPDQEERMKRLGEVIFYNDLAKTPEEWLVRCKDADIICTGKFGLKDKVCELSDVFISLPFVGVGFLDKDKLKSRGISVAYSPGCNKDAVSEWIIGMMINLLRRLPEYINIPDSEKILPERAIGLVSKKVSILGQGNIGSKVGRVCESLDMKVSFFKRGDDLLQSVKEADLIINCLSLNPETEKLLDKKFFSSLQSGSYYISVTSDKINDVDALIEALDKNILAGAAVDAGGIQVGDYSNPLYQKLASHPKIFATPHIAYNTDTTARSCHDAMIDNVEAWINGKPINLI